MGIRRGLGEGQGCLPSNATCNARQLRADNAINTIQPQLVNPAGGDFRPVTGGNVFSAKTFPIPDFSWSDAPKRPAVPRGTLSNAVRVDFANTPRAGTNPPGAYFTGAAAREGVHSPRAQGTRCGWTLELGEGREAAFIGVSSKSTPGASDQVLSLFSGNAPLASRPQLIIEYYVP